MDVSKCLHGCGPFWSSLPRVLAFIDCHVQSQLQCGRCTLNDYPYEMDRLEEVLPQELTEMDYSQDETSFPSFGGSLAEAEYVASVVHAKVLGTEHVLYAILHDGNALATRILERAGFLMKTRKIRSNCCSSSLRGTCRLDTEDLC